MNAGEVAELIERYNAAWNAQDLETIHALHHPEIVFDNHTAAERAEGADAVREHIAQIFRNNPGMTLPHAQHAHRRGLRGVRVDAARREGRARARVGRRRRLPDQERADRAEGRLLGVASSPRTVSCSTSGRL